MAKVQRLNTLAEKREQKLSLMALAWVLNHSPITSVLIGASQTTQIDDAVSTLNNCSFTRDELTLIDEKTL